MTNSDEPVHIINVLNTGIIISVNMRADVDGQGTGRGEGIRTLDTL
ncbi:MAG: hypothetical protein ISQ90_04600 [Rhodospirillales bacterium]|nr:hypothetical protein [Rhodospirillales bacterium]